MSKSLGNAVIATDLDGTVFFWNETAEQLYGWTATEAIGRPIEDLTVPKGMREFADEIMTNLRAGRPWSGVFMVHRRDKSTFSALVTDTGLHDERGQLVGITGVSINLDEVLRPLLQRSHEAAIATDMEGGVRFAGPRVTSLTGWPADELADSSWWDFVHPDDREAVRAAHAAVAGGSESLPLIEHRVRCADGTWLWVDMAVTNLLDETMMRGILLTLYDVRERRASMEELAHRAFHDPLTGLANRAAFLEYLTSHLATRQHEGALVYLDLDGFKQINDQFGHMAGDTVLRTVADRLRAAMRPEDVCCRLGGDEFAVLAKTVRGPTQTPALVRRVNLAISRNITVGDSTIRPKASIGIALLAASPGPEQAIHAADEDMYRRKRRQRSAPAATRETPTQRADLDGCATRRRRSRSEPSS
ncbi:MAG: diguanylate cyclase domain-containing protein [Actinomycetes bacterium]